MHHNIVLYSYQGLVPYIYYIGLCRYAWMFIRPLFAFPMCPINHDCPQKCITYHYKSASLGCHAKWYMYCRFLIMPLWSVAEWRARIGGSWCVVGHPFHKIRISRRKNVNSGVLYKCITSLLAAMIITLLVCTGPSLCEICDCKLILILSKYSISLSVKVYIYLMPNQNCQ